MRSYDVRFLKSDGSLSLFFQAECVNDEQAKRTALDLAPPGCTRYEIWSVSECVIENPVAQSAS